MRGLIALDGIALYKRVAIVIHLGHVGVHIITYDWGLEVELFYWYFV